MKTRELGYLKKTLNLRVPPQVRVWPKLVSKGPRGPKVSLSTQTLRLMALVNRPLPRSLLLPSLSTHPAPLFPSSSHFRRFPVPPTASQSSSWSKPPSIPSSSFLSTQLSPLSGDVPWPAQTEAGPHALLNILASCSSPHHYVVRTLLLRSLLLWIASSPTQHPLPHGSPLSP